MADPAQSSLFGVVLEVGSAVFGVIGTFLMSRRYTTSLLLFLLFPLAAPFMWLAGRGQKVSSYYQSRALSNREVPIATSRMALGLGLLCWAFFFQLLKLLTS